MIRAAMLAAVAALSGCLGPALSDFDRKLSDAEMRIAAQCADLDDPANAARIDALALLSSSTNQIADLRARRQRYCEIFGAN